MKIFVVLCLCFVAAMGVPSSSRPALEFSDDRDATNQYTLKYVTAEGTTVVERGFLVPTADGTDKVLNYEGEYTFQGNDGKTYVTNYTSNSEGGFQVVANHLPKQGEPLPVPTL